MIKSFSKIYKAFEEKQKALKKEYIAAGMTEKQIQELYDFDKQQLARDLAFDRRTQPLQMVDGDFDTDGKNPLLDKFFEKLAIEIDMSLASSHWWIEEIDNENLAKRLKCLTEEDLELLTYNIVEQFTQKELAKKYGISQKNINKKLQRIKKSLG